MELLVRSEFTIWSAAAVSSGVSWRRAGESSPCLDGSIQQMYRSLAVRIPTCLILSRLVGGGGGWPFNPPPRRLGAEVREQDRLVHPTA